MNAVLLSAISWSSLPSFDVRAALIVGAIVAVAGVVIITIAILTPVIAIKAGATALGTACAVAVISVGTGLIACIAAGVYWGHVGDVKREEIIETIKKVSNQLDVYFQAASANPDRAEDYRCYLVFYEERTLASKQPTTDIRKVAVEAGSSDEFYQLVQRQLERWFAKPVLADADGRPRRVVVFMRPFPGDGVYDRLKQLCEQLDRQCVVNRVEGEWQPAVSQGTSP